METATWGRAKSQRTCFLGCVLKSEGKFFTGLEAVLGLLLKGPDEDVFLCSRKVVTKRFNGRRWIVDVLGHDIKGACFGVITKRGLSCEGFVERDAHAVNIATAVKSLIAQLFWGHVDRGSHQEASSGEALAVENAGNPKVREFDLVLVCYEDIRGFDVTVDYVLLVGVAEAFESLLGRVQLLRRKGVGVRGSGRFGEGRRDLGRLRIPSRCNIRCFRR